MKISIKKNYKFFLLLCFSIFIASFFWDYIKLPYNENYDYGGQYYNESYNLNNDTIRFIFFILVSLLPFFIYHKKINKKKIYKLNDFIKLDFESINPLIKPYYIFLFILILSSTLNFIQLDFSKWVAPMDILHEGLWLTSSYNYVQTGGFWTSSYFDRGILGNHYPILAWKILSNETIGAVRFAELFILYLNKVLLIFLSLNISKNINWPSYKKLFFFITLSMFLSYLVPYDDQGQFVKRSIIILLFLNFLIISFDKRNNITILILLGLLSTISILWFLDVGFYLNFILINLILLLIIKKSFKKSFYIIFGIFLGWFLFYLFFSTEEINNFYFTTKNIILTMDQIHGLIYPTPFFSGETRATKALLFYVIGGIFVIYICLDKNHFNNNNKYFFLFLYLLSLVSFKTGLSRSDDPHIKTATGPLFVLIYSYLLFVLFNNKLVDLLIKKFDQFKFKNFVILLIIFFNFNLNNLTEIKNFYSNSKVLVNSDDAKFLIDINQNYNDLIEYINSNYNDLECIQVLNDDVALPFLLKKKSCTKYYSVWNVTPKYLQNDFVSKINQNKPLIVILESKNKFTPNLKIVEGYVRKNYYLDFKLKNWLIYKKK